MASSNTPTRPPGPGRSAVNRPPSGSGRSRVVVDWSSPDLHNTLSSQQVLDMFARSKPGDEDRKRILELVLVSHLLQIDRRKNNKLFASFPLCLCSYFFSFTRILSHQSIYPSIPPLSKPNRLIVRPRAKRRTRPPVFTSWNGRPS